MIESHEIPLVYIPWKISLLMLDFSTMIYYNYIIYDYYYYTNNHFIWQWNYQLPHAKAITKFVWLHYQLNKYIYIYNIYIHILCEIPINPMKLIRWYPIGPRIVVSLQLRCCSSSPVTAWCRRGPARPGCGDGEVGERRDLGLKVTWLWVNTYENSIFSGLFTFILTQLF